MILIFPENSTILCSEKPPITPDGYVETMRRYFKHCHPEVSGLNMTELFDSVLSSYNAGNLLRPYELITVVFFYMALIVVGSIGSLSVIIVVKCQPRMRNPHNLFTVNLAVGDLLLCLFTQPFNLIRLLYWHVDWTMGSWMCKAVETAQATNIFVSTLNISVIAIDRFLVIVYPRRWELCKSTANGIIFCIWLVALLIASPVISFTSVSKGTIRSDASVCSANTLESTELRYTKLIHGRITLVVQYLLPMIIVGFAYTRIYLKIRKRNILRNVTTGYSIHSVAKYNTTSQLRKSSRISLDEEKTEFGVSSKFDPESRLPKISLEQGAPATDVQKDNAWENDGESARQNRTANRFQLINQRSGKSQTDRQRHVRRRQTKANALLLAITLTFVLSWTPLHVFHLIMDVIEDRKIDFLTKTPIPKSMLTHTGNVTTTAEPTKSSAFSDLTSINLSGRHITIVNAVCLMCVHLAACINPVLYGWLNENFQKEFRILFRKCQSKHVT